MLKNWLIEPTPKITENEQRRQAKFLSMLLLFLLLIVSLYLLFIQLFLAGQNQAAQSINAVLTIGLLLITYVVSRTFWYETAVYIFAIGFGLIIFYSQQELPNIPILLIYFLLPVILATMVLSIKKTAVVALMEFIIMFGLIFSMATPLLFWQDLTLLVTFYVTFAGLILLSLRHRNQLEQTRQAQILQQETRFQTYFDNASDWLFALDAQGFISSINQVACHELGYSANEIIGKSPTLFLSEENKSKIGTMIQELFQGKEIPFAEVIVQDKNDRSIWLEVRGRKFFEDNKITGTFHIARNITDRKIAEDAREKLNREIKLLYETGRQLGQEIDLITVYTTIYDSIIAIMPFKTFIVSSYNTLKESLTIEFVRQSGQETDVSQYPILAIDDEKFGAQREVVRTGKSLLINDYFKEFPSDQYLYAQTEKRETTSAHRPCSAIMVPLKIDNDVQGIIQIHDDKINAFSQDNLYFLEALSSHVIAAITNANLLKQSQNELIERQHAEQEARKRQAVAETLQTSISFLNSSLSLEDVLHQILVQLHTTTPYNSAAIQQKEGDLLILKAAIGFQDNAALIGLSFPLTANLPNAEVVRTQSPLALDNVTDTYPEFEAIASNYQADGIYSWLGVPLVVKNEVIGMITLDRYEVQPFTTDEIMLASTFANHAAVALHNAALYRKLETHSETLEKAVATRTQELQDTIDQIRAILRNSPDAILVLNTDESIRRWNSAFRKLFSYTDNEIYPLYVLDLIAETDSTTFKDALETAVSTQTTQRLDITVQSKNGRFIEVNAALAPIQENDMLTGIVCNFHDISQLKEVERLKDAFVSNVSHELRTPITNLRLHHDLLSLNPQKQDVYMARLGREINRLNIIIEDLLRISRLDQKRIKPNLAELDLTTLADQYINDRKSSAENKQLTLSLSTTPAIPAIQGDAHLLEQVIGILLTNAMTYTPPGGEIRLSLRNKQEDGQTWAGLGISDTGSGIPESEYTQIFTRFFRGQSAIETGEPGTGLGLAIAQEIMNLHQGYIELESSSPENGTTFIIWLPASNQKG